MFFGIVDVFAPTCLSATGNGTPHPPVESEGNRVRSAECADEQARGIMILKCSFRAFVSFDWTASSNVTTLASVV
jgi:hypothetical protein